jgi:hypothetical protein
MNAKSILSKGAALLLGSLLQVEALPAFADTVYTVTLPSAGSVSVSGTITTNGNVGTLSATDFLNWHLTLTSTSLGASNELFGPGYGLASNSTLISYSDIIASATTLFIQGPSGIININGLLPGNITATHVIVTPVPPGTFHMQLIVSTSTAIDNQSRGLPLTGVLLADRGISTNVSPVCSAAQPFPAVLGSPNHQFVPVVVMGVTDPDGDAVTITVTGVTQDEPVNAKGDVNTSPDAVIEAGAALVRAERSGKGNGRVYQISFRAEDGKGGVCTGAVTVGVPHSMQVGLTAIDDGQVYDSTVP